MMLSTPAAKALQHHLRQLVLLLLVLLLLSTVPKTARAACSLECDSTYCNPTSIPTNGGMLRFQFSPGVESVDVKVVTYYDTVDSYGTTVPMSMDIALYSDETNTIIETFGSGVACLATRTVYVPDEYVNTPISLRFYCNNEVESCDGTREITYMCAEATGEECDALISEPEYIDGYPPVSPVYPEPEPVPEPPAEPPSPPPPRPKPSPTLPKNQQSPATRAATAASNSTTTTPSPGTVSARSGAGPPASMPITSWPHVMLGLLVASCMLLVG